MNQPALNYERTEYGVRVRSGTAYLAYICAGGSGFDIAVVSNGEWYEGADEIIAICGSEEEAQNAIAEYVG